MTKFIRNGSLNRDFLPTLEEIDIISKFQNLIQEDYKLIRCTKTMLEKSTIDASGQLRELFKAKGIVNFEEIGQGVKNKVLKDVGVIITSVGCFDTKVSFYRPDTKDGDPRFWPYGASRHLEKNVLLMITVSYGKLIFIPIIDSDEILVQIQSNFARSSDRHISYFKSLYYPYKGKWIKSCSPYVRNPKDVGETLEALLGMKPNSSKQADLNGIIEIKSKRAKSDTNDSLFSKVPNWKISPITKAADMIIEYGYDSIVHPGFKDLYVTVNSRPNNQGLFLANDFENEILVQNHNIDGLTCIWEHSVLRDRLWEKHPNTIWVKAQERIIDGKIHFLYDDEMEFTSNPVVSQFLTLIDASIVVFDWRGKVLPDGKKYRDHGHGFRISPKNRSKLFNEHIDFTV